VIVMRRFVAPRRAVMSRGRLPPLVAPVPRLPPLVARPAGGAVTVSDGVVVRRGCFPAGTGMALPECSAGIAHARARFVPGAPPSGCLLAGWNLGRGNDGGLGMTGAALMVGG